MSINTASKGRNPRANWLPYASVNPTLPAWIVYALTFVPVALLMVGVWAQPFVPVGELLPRIC